MIDDYGLCLKLGGIQKTVSACQDHLVGKCNGACIGKESPELYNQRVETALESVNSAEESIAIIGNGRTTEESSVILLEKGHYLGFGFIQEDMPIASFNECKELINPYQDNLDVQRIIRGYLNRKGNEKILNLNTVEI